MISNQKAPKYNLFESLNPFNFNERAESDLDAMSYEESRGTGELRKASFYEGASLIAMNESFFEGDFDPLNPGLSERSSSSKMSVEEVLARKDSVEFKTNISLYKKSQARQTLNIQTDYQVEKEYDRIKLGDGTETKVMKNYLARQQKYLQNRYEHQHLTSDEIAGVNNFKNNLEGVQKLYGFDVSTNKSQLVDDGKCDRVRQNALGFCQNSTANIFGSLGSFSGKLTQVKYLNILEQSVIEPEEFTKWKL